MSGINQSWRSNFKTYNSSLSTVMALTLAIMLGLTAVLPSVQAQTITVLHSFKAGRDGANPAAGLVRDSAGNLYGTTENGGNTNCALGCGTVFKVDATGKKVLLYSFTGKADGASPFGNLIWDAAGNLYGVTRYGGNFSCGGGCGTVFKVDVSAKETVLYSFTGAPDGAVPQAALTRDAAGTFYGTTSIGGDLTCNSGNGCGMVFKLDASGKETVLYAFTGGADGRFPSASMVRDAGGNLFSTTMSGGASGLGTVFKLDSTGKQTVLHSFAGGAGTVFKVDKSGNETVVYSFAGGADGAQPFAGLIHDAAGNFYGTTMNGGAFGCGTVFKLDSTGKETVLYSFTGGADGAFPEAGVIRDAAGNLYGTTNSGAGAHAGLGAVFKLAP